MEDFSNEFKKLGLKISYYRKLKGMTQEQLTERMDTSTSYIGAIEAPNMDKSISIHRLRFFDNSILLYPANISIKRAYYYSSVEHTHYTDTPKKPAQFETSPV